MKFLFAFLSLIFTPIALSQTLTGTVYDENKQTIPGASVYLDGTSIGTVTDDNGHYELTAKNKINTILVVNFIGYEPYFIQNPFQNPVTKIYLAPKTTLLKEVTVKADGFTRAQKLKVFRQQFLGVTKGGKSCKILNEDDISFRYDSKKSTLTATSEVPLRIENQYLGYELSFSLIDFNVVFIRKSMSIEDALSSYFAGTVVYKDLPGNDKSHLEKRQKAYLGSQMLFFRNLSKKIWGKKAFELYNGSWPANPDDYFSVTSEAGNYRVYVKPNIEIKAGELRPANMEFYSTFNLMYNRKEQSKVIFRASTFLIDEFGNTNIPDQVIFAGEMSKYRVGDLLPLDFPG